MADDAEQTIGTAKAAKLLGWHPRKVQRAAHTGVIPIVGKLNDRGDLLFSQAAIEELAKQQGTPPEKS